MSTVKQWGLISGLTLCSLLAGSVSAANGGPAGIIRFTGQIVEAPCVASAWQAAVSLSCYRDGKPVAYHYNAFAAANALPESVEEARINWINPERTQGVLTITYR